MKRTTNIYKNKTTIKKIHNLKKNKTKTECRDALK